MKRTFLFLSINIAILALILVITSILQYKGDILSLLIFSIIFGFAGSFISLFISKWLVKKKYRIIIIEQSANQSQKWLLERVAYYSKEMNIPIPEVGVYNNNNEVNAFAIGASKKSALVAFSVGLLENMDKKEVDGVIGHEIAHIANGDMVTMALIQGVVNTFVIFLSSLVSRAIMRGRNSYFTYFLITMVFQTIFGLLAAPIVCWFSRQREFRADAESAKYGSKEKMIASLKKLKKFHSRIDNKHPEVATMKINGKSTASLFSTHPPLDERIERLEKV